jgi:hypothetical protein
MSPGTSSSARINRVSPPRTGAFLEEAEQGVEDDHGEDDRGVDPEAQHQLGEGRAEQDIDEDVVELGQEPPDGAAPLAGGQAIGSVLVQPRRRFARSQALQAVGGEPLHDVVGRHRMPRHVATDRVFVCCQGHGRAFRLPNRQGFASYPQSPRRTPAGNPTTGPGVPRASETTGRGSVR